MRNSSPAKQANTHLSGNSLVDLFGVKIAVIQLLVQILQPTQHHVLHANSLPMFYITCVYMHFHAYLECDAVDDIKRINHITQRLAHLPSVFVSNHGMKVHLNTHTLTLQANRINCIGQKEDAAVSAVIVTSRKGSLSVSWRPSMTILATQKNRMS